MRGLDLLHLEAAPRKCCKSDVVLSCFETFGCSERLQGEDTKAKPSKRGTIPTLRNFDPDMKRSSSCSSDHADWIETATLCQSGPASLASLSYPF